MTAIEDFAINGNLWGYHEWQPVFERDFAIFGPYIRQEHPQTIEEEEGEMNHNSRKRLEDQTARKGLEDAGELLLLSSTSRKGLEKQECITQTSQDKKARFEEPNLVGGFETGLVDSGGWRKEIPSFCTFSYAHFMSRRTQFGGQFFAVFGALLVANPSRQPLFEPSDTKVGGDRRDPTGLKVEDANATSKGPDVDTEAMSEDEAKKILLEHPLPKARQRTNLVGDD